MKFSISVIALFDDETPSFLDIAPDLTTRSPTFQRKMFEEMDEKMRNFAQSQRREKIRLQSHWAGKVLQKDQELRNVKEEYKRILASYDTFLKKVRTPGNSRENSPVAQGGDLKLGYNIKAAQKAETLQEMMHMSIIGETDVKRALMLIPQIVTTIVEDS